MPIEHEKERRPQDALREAIDRNTAALLTVAFEIAKAGGRSLGSISPELRGEIETHYAELVTLLSFEAS